MIKSVKSIFFVASIFLSVACAKEKALIEKKDQSGDSGNLSPIPQEHTQIKLFSGNSDGYHSFRIPSIIKTNRGTLIAFAEGRKNNNKDYGDIDLVYKTSSDNGKTWSGLKEVIGAGLGTWGNPTAVVDQSNGRVWLFMSWNSDTHNQSGTDGYQKISNWGDRKVFVSYSDDDGQTWSSPLDLTSSLLPPGYTWDAMGPGIGIQKNKAGATGRLIIPAIGRNIYSDNNGQTWNYQLLASGTSEGTIIEKVNGELIRNDRAVSSQWENSKTRRVAVGTSAGFSNWASDLLLPDPANQASILRFSDYPNRILFLNSASTTTRSRMLLRMSYDEGVTWPVERRVYEALTEQQAITQGKGGYSSMIKTADNLVGALIEINENTSSSSTSNRSIEFHRFNLQWILNGTKEP